MIRVSNLKKPNIPATPVYYWLDSSWTLDEDEANEISENLLSSSLHGVAFFKPNSTDEEIDLKIKELVVNQRKPKNNGVMLQAINRHFL